MRIFALELDNDIKGVDHRKLYIELLIAQLVKPDLVILPELALCSYIGNPSIWQYADENSLDTSQWAMAMAEKYQTCIGVGYLEKQAGEYYNSYLLADCEKVFGIVRKSEGESFLFKRGKFSPVIQTPFGKVAIGICYDARRKHFYEAIKEHELALILFPHGSPANPKKSVLECSINDHFCTAYLDAFQVPVVYVNSIGQLDPMLGLTGKMMNRSGFSLNGFSKIYHSNAKVIKGSIKEAVGIQQLLISKTLTHTIPFFGEDIRKDNWLFRNIILPHDIKKGIAFYEKNKAQ